MGKVYLADENDVAMRCADGYLEEGSHRDSIGVYGRRHGRQFIDADFLSDPGRT
jgi:hypothetical protein